MTVDLLCALTRRDLAEALCRDLVGCRAAVVGDGADLDRSLARHGPDLVLISADRIRGEAVEDWIRRARARPERPDVVLAHDREDPEFRAAVLAAGGLAVVNTRIALETLTPTLQALVERRRDLQRLEAKAAAPPSDARLRDFVSSSPRMREFVDLAGKVVDADSSLLLLGETGTGKERLARAIHFEGPRAEGPFVPVNCGAIPETLLESELFGHEKGAFTGAIRARKGYFEQADGGTLFLDEIGELPVHVQVKLLRAIENREVRRVGGEQAFPIDVRVVAATHRDLEREVREHRFRQDLYYRLAVVTLVVPPLRERRADVPELCRIQVERFRASINREVEGFDDDAMEALVGYAWPGNVRELINVVERAVLLARGPVIRRGDLPRAISGSPSAPVAPPPGPATASGAAPGSWTEPPLPEARREAVRAFERAYLTRLLRSTGGRIGESARRAGVDERSLYDALRRHGLRKEDFRR